MARLRVSTILDASPEEVWADLRDISSHPQWMADAVGIRFLTAQSSGVGTRFEWRRSMRNLQQRFCKPRPGRHGRT